MTTGSVQVYLDNPVKPVAQNLSNLSRFRTYSVNRQQAWCQGTRSDESLERNSKYKQGYLDSFSLYKYWQRLPQIQRGSVRHSAWKHAQEVQIVSSHAILPMAIVLKKFIILLNSPEFMQGGCAIGSLILSESVAFTSPTLLVWPTRSQTRLAPWISLQVKWCTAGKPVGSFLRPVICWSSS